jgi:hypothetical protein
VAIKKKKKKKKIYYYNNIIKINKLEIELNIYFLIIKKREILAKIVIPYL